MPGEALPLRRRALLLGLLAAGSAHAQDSAAFSDFSWHDATRQRDADGHVAALRSKRCAGRGWRARKLPCN